MIHIQPKCTLVQAPRTARTRWPMSGVGVRAYLTRRFIVRGEYKGYVIFTNRDDNEEVNEWKAGFAFFF